MKPNRKQGIPIMFKKITIALLASTLIGAPAFAKNTILGSQATQPAAKSTINMTSPAKVKIAKVSKVKKHKAKKIKVAKHAIHAKHVKHVKHVKHAPAGKHIVHATTKQTMPSHNN